MGKTMLHLLGGLLAFAVLAAVPATASAGDSGGCNGYYGPYSHWGDGWYGHHGGRYYWRGWGDGDGYFDGYSHHYRCDAGRVARVMVAVNRMRGSQCQRLTKSGRLGRATSCSRTRWLRAHGTRHWRYRIGHRLPRGHYRLHHRAVDAVGNRGREYRRHIWIR